MSYGIIYKATNEINGKCYIGQTVRGLSERKRKHLSSKQAYYFHNALTKYGHKNFSWEIIEECFSRQHLDFREIFYIDLYDTLNSGYNMVGGGGSMSGWNHTEVTKEKISKASTEYYKNNKGPNLGKKFPKEFGEKISKANKGKIISDKQRKDHSKKMLGKGNPMYGKSGSNAPASKKYIITLPSGSSIVVHGLHKYCLENGLNSSCMVQCAKGKQKIHKGYGCAYYNEVIV